MVKTSEPESRRENEAGEVGSPAVRLASTAAGPQLKVRFIAGQQSWPSSGRLRPEQGHE